VKRNQSKELDSSIEDVKARQRNTTWPDVLRGGRSVDEFLWKGARDAPMVQRVGAVLLALAYVLVALFFIGRATSGGEWFSGVVGVLLIIIGVIFVRSATRR
jgi:hypothetical protein